MSDGERKVRDVTTAEKMSYPSDARLLIINADDFGMCHDENEATTIGLTKGLFTSSTILTTCPWFEEAAEFARNSPNVDLGHLDCHMGPLHLRADYHRVYLKLALDFRLPIRLTPRQVMRQLKMSDILDDLDRNGVLYPDNFVHSGPKNPDQTESTRTEMLRTLKPGISEICCHPALARDELKSCARDWAQRQRDFEYFTSEKTCQVLKDEGIELIGYRKLRDAMSIASNSTSLSGLASPKGTRG